MLIVIGILLFIIACAVAPGAMQWLFSVALGLAGLAAVIIGIGFVYLMVIA